MKDVINFISYFQGSEDVFLFGCCYWFAHILNERFKQEYITRICHEPIEGHFVTLFIDSNDPSHYMIADIRGDVTNKYKDRELSCLEDIEETDITYYRHLMRDCRDFLPPDDEE